MDLPVSDSGERPAGKPGVCYYCGNPAGAHKADCVCVTRSVVVRMSVEYIVSVPRSWSEEMIRFHRNDGTWCANNDLARLADAADERVPTCACPHAEFAYVREATPEDHMRMLDLAVEDKQ